MRRTLITTTLSIILGMALAGPPTDVPLVCGAADAPLVGVASLLADHVHLTLVDGALAACPDGVYGVIDGETVLTVTYTIEDGAIADVHVAIATDPESTPSVSYAELPDSAVEGMLGADRNRTAAFDRADAAREQAREHAADSTDDPSLDAPGDRDQDRVRDQDQLRDQDCEPVQDQDQLRDQDCEPVQDQDQDQDQDQSKDQDRDQDQDRDDCQTTCEGDGIGGPPTDLPATANPRRP